MTVVQEPREPQGPAEIEVPEAEGSSRRRTLPALPDAYAERAEAVRARATASFRRWRPELREAFATRWWPVVTLFVVLATTATLTNSWGAYVGDNRFEQYWNPARRLSKTLTIWDGSRGLGRVREEFWPAATVPMALLRGIGFTPTVVEHLYHALLIALVGVGMVAVVRLFQPRIGIEHVLAGLLLSFGAYSATFLLPSNLYMQYALAPWLFVVTFRGIHSERPWRWAAIFALLTFASGNVDTPGLVYACAPLVAVIAFSLVVERSVRVRNVAGWLVRAGLLALLVNAAMFVKTAFGAAALGSRLNDSESPEISAYTSSWPESFRGLGNWLSYFPNPGTGLLKPQGQPYFTNGIVVAFTFVPPAVALFVLWRSRWRIRILYAITMILSLIVLVGAFPIAQPSPVGNVILDAYSNIRTLAAFRNTYKIGAGLLIGLAGLAAYGVVLANRAVRHRPARIRRLPLILAVLTIAVTSFPFWTGSLYNPNDQFTTLPTYYSQAFDYLAKVPDDGRSLVLPQVSRTRYRWGWVGDDIFDALDARDHAIVSGVPDSNQLSANVLEALMVVASDPHYRPGVLAPIMRRLGLTEIVVRNDVDWQALSRPRPSAYDGIRLDPDFVKLATFGRPGENTTDPNDKSEGAERDRSYPPVEIFQLRDRSTELSADQDATPMVVAGDGYAWAPIAGAGMLDGPRPITYTGDADPAELARLLEAGAPLVVSDTNRRRLRLIVNYEPDYSYTLGVGQDVDRVPVTLFKDEAAQSVAWYPDATSISLTGPPRSVSGSHPWNRPSNTFDGDPTTLWNISRTDGLTDRVMRVDLRQATDVREARFVLPPSTPKGGGIRGGELRFSDGSRFPVDLTGGTETLVVIPTEKTTFIEFAITDINPDADTIGLADITFPGLDLREYVQSPNDIFLAAPRSAELTQALATAPTGYVFARSVQTTTMNNPQPGLSVRDEELTLRRRFFVAADRTFTAAGTMRLRPDTPDAVVDRAVGGDHGAYGSTRENGALVGYGGYAVDGDPRTSWLAPALTGETLTMRFPRQAVSTIDLSSQYDAASSRITKFEVEVPDPAAPGGSRAVPAETVPSAPGCDTDPRPPPGCVRSGRIVLETPVETDQLTVRVTGVSGREAILGGRIRVDEVTINDTPNTALFTRETATPECIDIGLHVEGAAGDQVIPVRSTGTVKDLLEGKAARFEGCEPTSLQRGWRLLRTDDQAPFDQVELTTEGFAEQAAGNAVPAPTMRVTDRSAHGMTVAMDDVQPGTLLTFNQSFDKNWQATVNGQPLGPARSFNTVNGWVIDESGPVTVEIRFVPGRTFGYALVISAGGVVLCLYLAMRWPRWRRMQARAEHREQGEPRG